MEIDVHGYTAFGSNDATIESVRMSVPDDAANRHRQMIRDEWEFDADGNRVNTIPPYVPDPAELRRLRYPDLPQDRFWAALRRFNYEVPLLAWVDSLKPTDPESPTYIADLDYWSVISAKVERGEIERDHPAIEDARVALGVAPAELDGMWDWAWQ
jgi:hypothetical protein